MKKYFLFVLMSILFVGISAQEVNRVSFNDDWKFQLAADKQPAALEYNNLKAYILPTGNDLLVFGKKANKPTQAFNGGASLPQTLIAFDDSKWRTLNLPHDWGVEGEFNQEYPGETGKLPWWGRAWYRKHLSIPASDRGKQIYLDIDGSMSYTSVFCNGQLAGGWAYGYSSFRIDLTPFVKYGEDNIISIHLDNIAESSRWYPGSGIYRNTWLVKKSPISVAHWGVFITTPQVSADRATVKLDITLDNANESSSAAPIEVITDLKDGDKIIATEKTTIYSVKDKQQLTQTFLLTKPHLWDINDTHRYQAITTINQEGKEIDKYSTMFGIRDIKFTASDGFHLNGRKVLLNGVCMHHDLGALGSAFNTTAQRRQLVLLKQMGCNALRTAHNPPAPELLDLCDELGILVMDEFSDTWTRSKKPNGYARLFDEWAEQDMRSFIYRDRNHPCVILWSTGNEIGEQGMPDKFWVSQFLTDIAHNADPSRLTTFGCNHVPSATNGFSKTGDVYGYNYKPQLYAKFSIDHPEQPFLGSETSSCISTRGEYTFPVTYNKNGGLANFQMSSYDLYAPSWAMCPDWEFKGQDENPQQAGEFVWTGFDYIGEPTPYNRDMTILNNFSDPEARAAAEKQLQELGKIPTPSRSSYFGIIDLAGFPKDRFYIYQARWRADLPMAHILPHWNWAGREGEITPVHVYTSGDSAELFVNGVSQGTRVKISPDKAPTVAAMMRNPELIKNVYRLCWDEVVYQPGEVKVVTYKDGKEWATDMVKTTGAPAKIAFTNENETLSLGSNDLIFISVSITDKQGNFAPRANNLLSFKVEGAAVIEATDNGDPTSHVSFKSHSRQAFNGRALVILRPTGNGAIKLTATSKGLAKNTITINS